MRLFLMSFSALISKNYLYITCYFWGNWVHVELGEMIELVKIRGVH